VTEPFAAPGIESRGIASRPPDGEIARGEIAGEPESPPASVAATLGLTPPHTAALAWVGGWFSGLIVLWLDPADRFVRLHALHAAIVLGGLTALAIGSWGLGLLMAFVHPILFRALTWLSTVTWAVLALVWIAGLVQAWRGRTLRWPLVSGWASRRADRLTFRHSTLPAPRPPL
jgi:uncharacterized membrane protein